MPHIAESSEDNHAMATTGSTVAPGASGGSKTSAIAGAGVASAYEKAIKLDAGVASAYEKAIKLDAGVTSAYEKAIKLDFSLHPLNADEAATCRGMVERERGSRLTLMPTHHMNAFGDLTGFKFECPTGSPGACLPISRRMFFGHTATQAIDGEDVIMRLMAHEQENRATMLRFLQSVETTASPALLDCIPDNNDAFTSHGLLRGTDLRTVECKQWMPEVPESIGIYHAYMRGYNRDVRAHKMFLCCSGGLEKASDAFCNLMIDVGDKCTAQEVVDSEEAWWLRKACSRARCRLLKGLADAFGLRVQHIQACAFNNKQTSAPLSATDASVLSLSLLQDIQSHTTTGMAIASTDTVEHDLTRVGGTVAVYNGCCDTTRPFNGILTRMHPAEGLWLFKGAARGEGFGSIYGDGRVCGAFPTMQPASSRASAMPTGDAECIVRLHPKARAGVQRYMCFDEAYFKTLERMQWDRDNGFIELMPIIVGLP